MKKAIRRLMRGPDGRMRVVFIDLETLQPITDVSGYEIVNSASNQVENVPSVDDDSEVVEEATGGEEQTTPTAGGGGGSGADYVERIRADKANAARNRFPPAPAVNQFPPAPSQPFTPTAGKPVSRPPANVGATTGRRSTLPGSLPSVRAQPSFVEPTVSRPGSIQFSDMALQGPPSSLQTAERVTSTMTPDGTVERVSPERPDTAITPAGPDGFLSPVGTSETVSPSRQSRGFQDVADVTSLTPTGPGRPVEVDPDLTRTLQNSVRSALGEGYGIRAVSGTYNAETQAKIDAKLNDLSKRGISPSSEKGRKELAAVGQVGSTRHGHGKALDFDVIGPDGKRVTDKDALKAVAAEMGYQGISSLGGPSASYMGVGRMHADLHRDRAPVWQGDKDIQGAFLSNRNQVGVLPGEMSVTPTPSPGQQIASVEPTLDQEKAAQRGMTTAQQIVADATTPTSEYFGYSAYNTPPGTDPNNLTAAQMAGMGYGWNDLTDDDIADLALVAAGELSPSARASIASGTPTADAVEAFGNIMGTMSNRAASRNTTPVQEAYRPDQYSAVNPDILGATRGMYTPVAAGMNQAVSDFYSGRMANDFGIDQVVANPSADHYWADYIDTPNWAANLNAAPDPIGHYIADADWYSDSPTSRQMSQFGIDQRGREASSVFSDPGSGFSGPSRFGSQYVDSPAHGMTGARGGFTSDYGGSSYSGASYDSGRSYTGGGPGWGSSGDYSRDSSGGGSYGAGSQGWSGGGFSSGPSTSSPAGGSQAAGGWSDGSRGGSSSSSSGGRGGYGGTGSHSGGAAKDAGEHASGSGGYGSGSWV